MSPSDHNLAPVNLYGDTKPVVTGSKSGYQKYLEAYEKDEDKNTFNSRWFFGDLRNEH
ncbi:MAG: hypothetical protein JNJ51_05410 [Methylobacillus glycogenes]|nr:hypothetical protein [Methylobacillus glycogenes]